MSRWGIWRRQLSSVWRRPAGKTSVAGWVGLRGRMSKGGEAGGLDGGRLRGYASVFGSPMNSSRSIHHEEARTSDGKAPLAGGVDS